MHTRRTFLWTLGAGLWTLASGKTGAQVVASVPAPVDVVKQFLAARAAQDYAKAYALLSADTRKIVSYSRFTDVKSFQEATPHAAEDGVSPLMLAVGALFMDMHNTMGEIFTVVGSDPADPHTVLVKTQPLLGGTADNSKSFTLRVVTALNPQGKPRLELIPTCERTSPADTNKMRESAWQKVSMSNLKTIALSFFQYDTDHKHLPDAAAWTDAIQPYLGNTYMLRDPSAPDGQQFSYAFNRALSGVSLNSVSNPAQTVLAFTSTLGTKNAADAGQSLPKPGWHSGGSIVAFCDGHVTWVKDGMPLSFTP